MGQTLSAPATEKHGESGEDVRYAWAMSEMQGWRISMEDAHTAILELEKGDPKVNTFFAVYDGHGGQAAAKYAGEKVHQKLLTLDAYRAGRWPEALKRAFLDTDEDMKTDPAHLRDPSGCTAVAALLTHDRKILVANAGDSRAVLSVKGEVKPMSYDHKPQSETEKARIMGAGGYVEYGRVNGNLALSRALGDFEYKKNGALPAEDQIITADPDIIEHEVSDEDEFLVIACDGIWDCLTSQQVVDIVRRKVADGLELEDVAHFFSDLCLAPDTNSGAGIGCDNTTVLIVALLHGRTKAEWRAWVTDRVARKYGYETPAEAPQIFAPSRIAAFQARQKLQHERDERERAANPGGAGGGAGAGAGGANAPGSLGSLLANSGLGSFARVLGSSGGLSFQPGSGLISDTGSLMFDKYDSEEESEEEGEAGAAGAGAGAATGAGFFAAATEGDANKSLRAQLAELDEREGEPTTTTDGKGAGAATAAAAPVKQLETQPGGDLPTPAVKAEGLMDTSEDPLKG